jgi:hypothetical protein
VVSIATNWGKAFDLSVARRGVDPDGSAPPSHFHLILIGAAFAWDDPDPDIENITQVAGAINPSGAYTAPTVARQAAAWNLQRNNTLDRAELSFAVAQSFLAAATVSGIRGYAVCTAGTIASTTKVLEIIDFASPAGITISAGQELVTPGGQINEE